MSFFNQLTLKNKIFISCLGFVLLVSVLIGLFTRSLLISSLTSELKRRGIGIAQGIADNSRVFILTKNRAELTALAYDARLGNRKDIVRYLVIGDDTGRILAHTFTTGFPDFTVELVSRQDITTENVISTKVGGHAVFHAVVPVKEGIYTIGSVQVGLDRQHIEKLISNLRLVFFSFLSLVSVIFFFLSHRLALLITKPVSSLIRYTDQLRKGDFNILPKDEISHPQPAVKEDEISQLTDSFIKMTRRLKESTQNLTESQKKYRSLFKSGPNPIFVVDKNTFEILDANPNATELFGYTRDELVTMKLFDLGSMEDEPLFKTDTDGEPRFIRSRVKFYTQKGSPVFVNIHASPSEYRDEDVIIVAATDISELVEKDSQLIQASKMTNLEKMSAGIAHEINQPLNAIKMGSEYLTMMAERKQVVNDADMTMVLNQISTQVTRASEIVGRLKTFSRKADFSRDVININTCIRSVHKIIGRQIALQNIDLELVLSDPLPTVMAHNNRLEQVIFNLVTNSRDAINERIDEANDIDRGKIRIHTFFDGDTVAIEVMDNGMGIDPDHRDSIFESFYTTKEMGEGLGLGLPIIQGIIKDYNGTISVSSEPGQGTCFRISFPAHQNDNPDSGSEKNEKKA